MICGGIKKYIYVVGDPPLNAGRFNSGFYLIYDSNNNKTIQKVVLDYNGHMLNLMK